VKEHYALIFEQSRNVPFSNTKHSDSKMRYYRIAGDFFEFKDGATTIGLLVGTPVDWSSYYIRSAAVLPAYQGRKVIQRFFPLLFERLKEAGLERVEADTSPSNMATMHLLTRLRFNVSGTILSERWGAHVHFTKFLSDGVEDAFLGQFCSGVMYQQRERDRGRCGCTSSKGG
jgi:RimJ/RimL family protein N-acetyltransferase